MSAFQLYARVAGGKFWCNLAFNTWRLFILYSSQFRESFR